MEAYFSKPKIFLYPISSNIVDYRPNIVRISSECRRISSKMSPKGRTEMMIGVAGAKLHKEADFDVQKWLAPQKPSQKCEKLISNRKNKSRKKNRCQKMKCGEPSETRFGKVSGRTELC